MTDLSTNPPPSVEGRERLFPRLTPAQLERLLAHGQTRQVAAGQVLLEPNDHTDSFFAILDGEIDIVRPRGAGEELIVVHGPAEFVGDVHLLSGRRSVVRARARTDGRVIELSRDSLLGLIQTDAELSGILMREFILRRVELMSSGAGDVVPSARATRPGPCG
jgi:thioredoxin reductase (NADPH)